MNRREFLKTFGQGLLGLGVAAASPATVAKAIAATGAVSTQGEMGDIAGLKGVPLDLGYAPRLGAAATFKRYDISADSMNYRRFPTGMTDDLISQGWVLVGGMGNEKT